MNERERPYQPYNTNLVTLARANRKQPTPAEHKIWSEILRKRQLAGYKFVRQKPIDGYIVDFYCAELGLVIEIDGSSHDDKRGYDAERTRILAAYGLHIIRYKNADVQFNIRRVRTELSEIIKKRIQALKPTLLP